MGGRAGRQRGQGTTRAAHRAKTCGCAAWTWTPRRSAQHFAAWVSTSLAGASASGPCPAPPLRDRARPPGSALCLRSPATPPPSAGKVHGSLARAGKVRGQTPKVAPQEKKKKIVGRGKKRLQYNRRFVNVVVGVGKKRGPNTQPLGKMG